MIEIEGTPYTIIQSSEVIESDGKQGRKFWQGHVVMDSEGRFYTTTSSYHETVTGAISKTMWAVPYYAHPKNVGRKNATTNEEQAKAEFASMVEKERRLRSGERVKPMLAQTLTERHKYLHYPLALQPKYDGKRLLSNGEMAWSRGNKDQKSEPVAHIFPFDTWGMIVDGELLLPHRAKVNEVMSAAHKYHPGVSDTLIYMLYDIADLTLPFDARWYRLKHWYYNSGADKNPFIKLADIYHVPSKSVGMDLHARLTEQGYEGTMWRNNEGLYLDGKRSNDLQKHKDFEEGEFLIVDIVPQGDGIGERRAKFICADENGEEFESNATGDEAQQMEYLQNKHLYTGKYAKVKYREFSGKNRVPFHSNVLEVRETKDGGY